ncbi:anti-sigma factor [Herbiconiux sp. P18]|uniref:anti-sigma factor n=1 Tax=Herbiconiux liangxiaofengii TaxID=3342795 RepID=UPI0035BBFF8B
MTHIDSDALAMIALGDAPVSEAERIHLAGCVPCSEELAELTRVVALGRAAQGPELVPPPAAVWTRIRSELQLDGAPAVVPASSHRAPRRRAGRRSRLWLPIGAAALVVGLVAGAGAGIWWQATTQPATQASGIVVAGAQLDPFPSWPDARGSAVVQQDADGRRQVVVDVDPATDSGSPAAELREVWLIRTDGTGLISIGFLDGTEGRFDIPPGIDIAQYALVDISAETDDGDPGHSGDSIVRGELRSL